MNIVMSGDGRFVEVQGTAEGQPFDRSELDQLLDLGAAGCARLAELQQEALARDRAPARGATPLNPRRARNDTRERA